MWQSLQISVRISYISIENAALISGDGILHLRVFISYVAPVAVDELGAEISITPGPIRARKKGIAEFRWYWEIV